MSQACTYLLGLAFLFRSCGARIRTKIPESTTRESTKDDLSDLSLARFSLATIAFPVFPLFFFFFPSR